MPVAAPADKRFRRARVRPARKRWWKPGWRAVVRAAVLAVVVSVVASAAVSLLLSSQALTVTRFTLQGNRRVSDAEVLALLNGLAGQSLLSADLEGWRRRLLSSPWVADAAIRRKFPGTLSVAILEREPMAIARAGDGLWLVDWTGAAIDEFRPGHHEFDLPLVDGLIDPERDGDAVDRVRAGLVGRLIQELSARPALEEQVSQIDVTDAGNLVLGLRGSGALVRLGDERFSDRLQLYLDLEPRLREQMGTIDYVDLRFAPRVYVKPLETGPRGPGGDLLVTGAVRQSGSGG